MNIGPQRKQDKFGVSDRTDEQLRQPKRTPTEKNDRPARHYFSEGAILMARTITFQRAPF